MPDELGDLDALLADAEADVERVERISNSVRPPDKPPRELPTIGKFGPYAITGRLALGGMAEILLAREEAEGAGSRYLVVKRILAEYDKDETFVEMFLDEARVMMRLKHPNVCHVYKFGKEDDTHFIAMEWVHGTSLGKLIRQARRTGGVPVPVALAIIASIAEALDYAHTAKDAAGEVMGIVHRDVTPDNIMVSYDGSVKLLDFGIAKAKARSHKTQAGVVKGKFAYMAPEQCRGKELDHRVDVFALGICLFESLTGRQLYRRETEFETMEAIVRGPVPRLADRVKNPPAELERILARCLAKRPGDRYQTAGELQEDIVGYLGALGEVVTARRIKELMHKLFRDDMQRGPVVDTTPFGSSFHMDSETALPFFPDETGEGAALPLPALDLPPPAPRSSTPAPYVHDPEHNARPGHALRPPPTVSGDVERLRPVHPAAHQSSRPPPTAPPSYVPDAPSGSSSGSTLMYVAVAALVLAAAGGLAYYVFFMGPAPETTGPDEPVVVNHTGSLAMFSEPPGASLYVDGELRGVTPLVVSELPTGTRSVRLELEGYETHEGTIEVRADAEREVTQALTAIVVEGGEQEPVARGRLNLSSTPPANVFHEETDLGLTPLRRLDLPAGVVRLRFVTTDGREFERAVLVPADDIGSTSVNLE